MLKETAYKTLVYRQNSIIRKSMYSNKTCRKCQFISMSGESSFERHFDDQFQVLNYVSGC